MPESVTGWDVGGAHLKVAMLGPEDDIRRLEQLPCPLWRGLRSLHDALPQVARRLGPASIHAITMTGELVDLFEDRPTGVARLLDTITAHLGESAIHVYAGQRGFLDPRAAKETPFAVASANWRASASLAARHLRQCVFVDIGSTTTDIVVCRDGEVDSEGKDDHARLASGELLYTGLVRTPVATLADRVPIQGRWCTLMAEQFATTADIYRLTADLPAHADLMPAADNGGKTTLDSARRLARMVGLDIDSQASQTKDLSRWRELAAFLKQQQQHQLSNAVALICSRREVSPTAPLVGAGCGRFLVQNIAARWGRPYVDFSSLFKHTCGGVLTAADCAPAVAVAGLLRAGDRAEHR